MVESGIVLLKYWLEVSEKEQTRRLTQRIEDGRKIWKLSPMDLQSYSRWYDYSRARDAMFAATDLPYAPWYVVGSDDKRRARLNLIRHLLSRSTADSTTPGPAATHAARITYGSPEPHRRIPAAPKRIRVPSRR